MKIHGYTLHGDYYLADKVIPNKTWEEACKMKEVVTLPNGKMAVAHTFSKEELKTVPREERGISENGHYWYWTSTPYDDNKVWYVLNQGGFGNFGSIRYSSDSGGARLGFHKSEIKRQPLDIE